MARPFLTVPDSLLGHAECAANFFEGGGYNVTIENHEIGYPNTPTLHCDRDPTILVVEVDSQIGLEKMKSWARYARSSNRDVRVAMVVPVDSPRTPSDEATLRELGVGLYVSDGEEAVEVIMPQDGSVNVQLPELKTLAPSMRRVLGAVYDQFAHSHWREGFEAACQVVEAHAREYLKAGSASGRITFARPSGKPYTVSELEIERMTMGDLAKSFREIQLQNLSDSIIADVLSLLNKDRIKVVHHKAKSEPSLRQNVGQHMWRVIAALKELLGA